VVQQELAAGSRSLPVLDQALNQDWIQVAAPKNLPLISALMALLDPGEAAAIALANELQAGRVLLDERRARKVALRMNLPVMGVLGCLVDAKQRGLIPEVRQWLEALRVKAGFRVSDELIQAILRIANE
jgi:predicted nucleic acid-binding protein